MQPLTDQGWQTINDLARRYGVSTEAVTTLLQAVVNGNGSMAQFNHWELGGGGQWMRGGMTMVGDMFNHGLKAKVDGLCHELSQLLDRQPFVPAPPPASSSSQSQWQGAGGSASLFVPGSSGSWWPGDLGQPNSSGGQNNVRYAYFAGSRRLAVELNGRVTVYDTLDHQIGGVSQQQGYGGSLTFTSQYGTVDVASLPVVSVDGVPAQQPQFQPQPQAAPWNQSPAPQQSPPQPGPPAQDADIFATIERLADLQQKGIISPEEFASKKADLLGRL